MNEIGAAATNLGGESQRTTRVDPTAHELDDVRRYPRLAQTPGQRSVSAYGGANVDTAPYQSRQQQQ